MVEVVISLAKTVPFDALVDMLEESIKEYKANPTQENKGSMCFRCLIMTTAEALQGQDLEQSIKDWNLSKKGMDLLKPNMG